MVSLCLSIYVDTAVRLELVGSPTSYPLYTSFHQQQQDATTNAIMESIHTTIPIQLVWSTFDQVFIKDYGIPPIGTRWYKSNTDLTSKWWYGIGTRWGVGYLYAHVFDGWTSSLGVDRHLKVYRENACPLVEEEGLVLGVMRSCL